MADEKHDKPELPEIQLDADKIEGLIVVIEGITRLNTLALAPIRTLALLALEKYAVEAQEALDNIAKIKAEWQAKKEAEAEAEAAALKAKEDEANKVKEAA